MAFDWKRLEQDERRRYDRVALVLGATMSVTSAVGIVVSIAIGHSGAAIGGVVQLVIGLAMLAVGLHARHRADREPGNRPGR